MKLLFCLATAVAICVALSAIILAAEARPPLAQLLARRRASGRPQVRYDVYDEREAVRAWYFAKSSGCAPDQMEKWDCPSCRGLTYMTNETLTDVAVFTNETLNARSYVGYSALRDEIIVAFRGSRTSDGGINWIENLDFTFRPVDGCPESNCNQHTGFHNEWSAVAPNVTAHVKLLTAKYPTAVVFIGAHSLGAAMASLAAVNLIHFHNVPVVSVYGFGTPATYNVVANIWAEGVLAAAGASLFRVVNKHDVVPALPPVSFGYVQLAKEVWYPLGSYTAEQRAARILCKDGSGASLMDFQCSMSVSILDRVASDHEHYFCEAGCSYQGDCNFPN